eukprot:m.729272 g.729272  ORF g.729272 m.729272 type:complete len:91 (-) comp58870_c0_seq91:1007-1279(-)
MTALKNTIEPGNIKHIIEGHQAAIPVLTREFVSDSINLTNANVTIRWFMLHAHGDLSTPFFLQGLQPTSDARPSATKCSWLSGAKRCSTC